GIHMNTPYPSTYNSASNASRILQPPMPNNFPQFAMTTLPPQQQYPMMMMLPQMQPHPQQLPMQNPCFPIYSFPTHNFPLMPFFPFNQLPVLPSPNANHLQSSVAPPDSTPTTSRTIHNTSLNASLLGASSSFSDSVRFNPLGGRGRSRDHSLLIDQTTSSSDRSFHQSFLDPHEMANNNELINYCINELCRKQLTEQELVAKVSKSRRFRKFGMQNLPAAISIILNTFPCFISRTVILKTSPNDLQPISKTLWKSDKRFQRTRGNKLNATMFDIPERNSGAGEVLSVLQSLNLDENQPPTRGVSEEEVLDVIKV
ncbi:hypothetical protein PMAYCL1PPCAC_29895, partial [Pristionchus mayeri]